MTTAPSAPTLLNADGSTSMATMFLTSHHGFRRDIALFAIALGKPVEADRAHALQDEWKKYCEKLHGHHMVEDQNIFPGLRAQHASLAAVIDQLGADHRRIDPLLAEGERAFAGLPGSTRAAAAVVTQLSTLLDRHLALEEEHIVPFLRDARQFPLPASDAEAQLYAEGFAWSLYGIAPDVTGGIYALLPEMLLSKLPAARADFEARCERLWGVSKNGASRTSVPDWLART
jgi:hemerythrin-like domain-containing protein